MAICTQAPHMRECSTRILTRGFTLGTREKTEGSVEHHGGRRRRRRRRREREGGRVCVNSATLRPPPLPCSALALPPAGTRVRGSNEGAVNFPHPLFLPVTFPPSVASPIIPPLHFRIGRVVLYNRVGGRRHRRSSLPSRTLHCRSFIKRSANRGLNTNV